MARNESNNMLTWIGPDCINTQGLNMDHLHMTNLESLLNTKIQDLEAKETAFF